MVLKSLRWSERALEDNRKLTDYLLNEWGEEITLRVREQIDKATERIRQSPEQFPVINRRRNVRRCVMSQQTSIYFKEKKDYIEISALFDNRQNPRKLKL